MTIRVGSRRDNACVVSTGTNLHQTSILWKIKKEDLAS